MSCNRKIATDARAPEKCDRISTRRPNLWSRRTSAAARLLARQLLRFFQRFETWLVRSRIRTSARSHRLSQQQRRYGEIQTVQIAVLLTLVIRFTWTPIRESCFLTKFKILAFRRPSALPSPGASLRLAIDANLLQSSRMQSSRKERLLGEERSSWTVIERSTVIFLPSDRSFEGEKHEVTR